MIDFERGIFIRCSTYLCIHSLILVCALTGDQTHNLGALGWCSNQLSNPARIILTQFLNYYTPKIHLKHKYKKVLLRTCETVNTFYIKCVPAELKVSMHDFIQWERQERKRGGSLQMELLTHLFKGVHTVFICREEQINIWLLIF